MGYTAGTLDLSILGVSESAVASIDKTVKSLNSLSRAIAKINASQTVMAGNQLTLLFEKMGAAASKMDATKISSFASAAKSLGAISKIGNLATADFGKISEGFKNLTVAITPFIAKAKEAEASLTALHGIMQKASGKKIQGLLGGDTSSTSTKSSAFGFLNLAKWTTTIYMARRLGRIVGNIVQSGADYTETLNLWETAMGNNLSIATEFVDKMNEAYGISEKTLMNAQAIFKNMLGSLGQISDQMAYSLSEGITQMALDYASLYNVTFEQAFTKFQAALAGQVRPIRSVAGYDITENTLFQLYQSLGGQKSMRQLSRTEKQLLSILAIFNQMSASGAVGDLDKTMESFANQSRVMAEAWQEIATYSGVLITNMLQESGLMQYTNGVLLFLGETLKALVEFYNAEQSFGGNIFEETTEGANDANDAIDKVQGKLLDFDKFRSLNSSSGDSDLGLDERLAEALASYGSILSGAAMEAREFADELKIASGLFDENGVFQGEEWEELTKKIKSVGMALVLAFTIPTVLKAITLIKSIPTLFKAIGDAFALISLARETSGTLIGTANAVGGVNNNVLKLANVLKFIKSPLGIIVTILGILYITNEDVRNSINNLFGSLSPLINLLISSLIPTISSVTDVLSGTLNILGYVAKFLIGNFTAALQIVLLNLTPVVYVFETLLKIVQTILTVLGALISFDFSSLGEKLSSLWTNWSSNDYAKNSWGGLTNTIISTWGFKNYASGGLPDKGTVFRAGEAGAEIVYNSASGQSGVANIQQIAKADYAGTKQALSEWWASARNDIPAFQGVSSSGIYTLVDGEANRRGKKFANI